jgi:hypothetical protein
MVSIHAPQLIPGPRGSISGADLALSIFFGCCNGATAEVIRWPNATGPLRSRYAFAMPKEPKPHDVDFHEVTNSATYADNRNFYKVEKWMRDWTKVDSLLYAGNSLRRAQEIFTRAINHRPRIRLTIRQRTRVLQQWPRT